MRVYLVRHAKASKDAVYTVDEERPLTGRGRQEIEAIARFLAGAGVSVAQIRHSGVLRAQQTAEILGTHLKPPGGVIAVSGLLWDDPMEPLAQKLPLEPEPVMLVGHNPSLERLIALLLGLSPERIPVALATSSAVCLEHALGEWSVVWALHRELFGAKG